MGNPLDEPFTQQQLVSGPVAERECLIAQALCERLPLVDGEHPMVELAHASLHEIEDALVAAPVLFAPLIRFVNGTPRTLKAETGLRLKAYPKRLRRPEAHVVAEWLAPRFAVEPPAYIQAILRVDRSESVRSEMRQLKGRLLETWTRSALRSHLGVTFDRGGKLHGADVDASYPDITAPLVTGEVKVMGDSERAQRVDSMKRAATVVKAAVPGLWHFAVVHLPSADGRGRINRELTRSDVDAWAFAGASEGSVHRAVGQVVAKMPVATRDLICSDSAQFDADDFKPEREITYDQMCLLA